MIDRTLGVVRRRGCAFRGRSSVRGGRGCARGGGVFVRVLLWRGVSIKCIREKREEEEHTKSDEKLVIVTIVQTVDEVA